MSKEKQRQLDEINRPRNEELFNNLERQYEEIAKVRTESEQIEKDELFSILSNTINGANFDDLSEAVYKISDVAGYRKQSENIIELPCKVGDRIYRLNRLNTAFTEAIVKAIYITHDKKYYPKPHIIIQYDLQRGRLRVNFSEFGNTVFLTREEAKNALSKMKGGE